jgi:hypothetical protein
MRIPGGEQFGQVVARPGPLVQTSAEDMGAGLGKGLEQAGGAAINYGMDLINKQNREKALADQEAKANAKEAARVKALTATAEVRNGLRSFQSQIENGLNDGTVDKSELDSKWAEGSTKMVDDAIAKVDPTHQELVRATLLDDMGAGQQHVTKKTFSLVGFRTSSRCSALLLRAARRLTKPLPTSRPFGQQPAPWREKTRPKRRSACRSLLRACG